MEKTGLWNEICLINKILADEKKIQVVEPENFFF